MRPTSRKRRLCRFHTSSCICFAFHFLPDPIESPPRPPLAPPLHPRCQLECDDESRRWRRCQKNEMDFLMPDLVSGDHADHCRRIIVGGGGGGGGRHGWPGRPSSSFLYLPASSLRSLLRPMSARMTATVTIVVVISPALSVLSLSSSACASKRSVGWDRRSEGGRNRASVCLPAYL